MLDGRERLERLVGRPLTLLAYPHGPVERAKRGPPRTRFSLGFTTSWHRCGPETEAPRSGRVKPGPVSLTRFSGRSPTR
jgi:hypothetical protein